MEDAISRCTLLAFVIQSQLSGSLNCLFIDHHHHHHMYFIKTSDKPHRLKNKTKYQKLQKLNKEKSRYHGNNVILVFIKHYNDEISLMYGVMFQWELDNHVHELANCKYETVSEGGKAVEEGFHHR